MRASIIFATLFTTAVIAAPILDGTQDAVTDKVTSLADDLEATIAEGAADIVKRQDEDLNELIDELELDNLISEQGLSGLTDKLDITDITSDITKRQNLDITSGLTSEITSDVTFDLTSDLENTVPTIDLTHRLLTQEDLLTTLTSTTTTLSTTLTSLTQNLEDLDISGALTDIEALIDDLLAEAQALSNDADLGMDLSALQPTLNTLSDRVGALVEEMQSLLDGGVVSDATGEIVGELTEVRTLVDGLMGVETLVGSF